MKKQILFAIILACAAMTANARIWRVNNNPGINADYTSLAAAIAAAADDDVIYVEPSATAYDNSGIGLNKRLKIIGNGSFLSNHPGLQANSNDSRLAYGLSFLTGSSGTSLYGLSIGGAIEIPNLVANDITIQRCKIGGSINIGGTTRSNIFILENWITGGINHTIGAITDFRIKNNIILNSTDLNTISIQLNDVVVIENNVIRAYNTQNGLNLNGCNHAAIINNIFLSQAGLNIQNGVNASFSNNFSTDNTLPTGNGNQININTSGLFSNLAFSSDSDVQLGASSPALNLGLYGSGDDIGAFNDGTNRPTFVLGLIPPFPTIYALTSPGIVVTPTMTVTISTKSNN